MAAAKGDSSQLKPAYLIAGTDEAKIQATIARLRSRAEAEGGPGALEDFSAEPGSRAAPDADALLASMPALSLTAERRYLFADGVERWSAKQVAPLAEALAALPPDLTVVLVARVGLRKAKAPLKALEQAVRKAGGDVVPFEAPRSGGLPGWVLGEARKRGLELERDAARLLVARMGSGMIRLATELDRLALWAEPGQTVTSADLEAMIADTSEEMAWTLSDAIVDHNQAGALAAAERLAGQGEAVTPLVAMAAKRLREAHAVLVALEAGELPRDAVNIHPYALEKLLERVRGRSLDEMRAATCAIADLEWWTRGGADYPDQVALTLAVRRAAGAGGG